MHGRLQLHIDRDFLTGRDGGSPEYQDYLRRSGLDVPEVRVRRARRADDLVMYPEIPEQALKATLRECRRLHERIHDGGGFCTSQRLAVAPVDDLFEFEPGFRKSQERVDDVAALAFARDTLALPRLDPDSPLGQALDAHASGRERKIVQAEDKSNVVDDRRPEITWPPPHPPLLDLLDRDPPLELVEIDAALLFAHDAVEAAGHVPDRLYGFRTDRKALRIAHAFVARKLEELEARGRPYLIVPTNEITKSPTWIVKLRQQSAHAERDEAFRRGKLSAARRPGQDVYARRARVVNMRNESGEFHYGRPRDPAGAIETERMMGANELDPLAAQVEFERVLEAGGLDLDELRSKRRERRLVKARKHVIVVMSRAPAPWLAKQLNVSERYVRRIRSES
jgi:hypothetical protein